VTSIPATAAPQPYAANVSRSSLMLDSDASSARRRSASVAEITIRMSALVITTVLIPSELMLRAATACMPILNAKSTMTP